MWKNQFLNVWRMNNILQFYTNSTVYIYGIIPCEYPNQMPVELNTQHA